MNYFFYTLFLCCFSAFGFSQNNSSIDFTIKNLGVNVDGHFTTFTINAEFDTNNELKKLSGKITASSIKTGIDNRDEHLLEEDYFDVVNHQYILLESTAITKESLNKYNVKANITLKGKTQSITIPVITRQEKSMHKITSYFEINRKDFDVGGGSFVMSKTVKIHVTHYQEL